MKWTWLLIIVLTTASACNAGRGEDDDDEAPHIQRLDAHGRVVLTRAEKAALDLKTVSATRGKLTTTALRFGKVAARPKDDAVVVAPVTARLVETPATLGDSVDHGDGLVVIEPLVDAASRASLEAQRRSLQGEIEGARAQVEAKKRDLQRLSALTSTGLATDAERAQAKADLESEQAKVASLARAKAALGHLSGGQLTVRAPIDGTVVRLASDTGSLVEQGAVLARLVDPGPRWINLAVPPGDPIGSGYRVHGVSERVSAKLLSRGQTIGTDGTRTDRLQARADASRQLPPGATLAVDVLHDASGVIVPIDAVVRRGHQHLVFVQVDDDHFAPHEVELGARDRDRVIVRSGLSAGARVVSRGAAALLGELGRANIATVASQGSKEETP